jgi:hypothetical protein
MMIGYDIYDSFAMEHFRLRQRMTLTTKIYFSRLYIYQAMTLTKGSVLWNGLPQSDNIASPTFSEKNRNPLNLSLYNTFIFVLDQSRLF